jgi:hypothetical protein
VTTGLAAHRRRRLEWDPAPVGHRAATAKLRDGPGPTKIPAYLPLRPTVEAYVHAGPGRLAA